LKNEFNELDEGACFPTLTLSKEKNAVVRDVLEDPSVLALDDSCPHGRYAGDKSLIGVSQNDIHHRRVSVLEELVQASSFSP